MKNETEGGILSLLSSIIKKSIDVPEEVVSLSNGVKILASEITKVANSVSKLSKLVNDHHDAIEQLLTVQAYIIANMKPLGADPQFPELHKEKSEKPN